MICGREYLPLGQSHVLLAPRDDEHRLLSADGGLNVRVGLGAEGLDLATCKEGGKGYSIDAQVLRKFCKYIRQCLKKKAMSDILNRFYIKHPNHQRWYAK